MLQIDTALEHICKKSVFLCKHCKNIKIAFCSFKV